MVKLRAGQFNRASEILGNVSVAWFSIGIISPVLTNFDSIIQTLGYILLSLIMSLLFVFLSMILVK